MDELLGFLFDRLNGDGQLMDLYRKAGGATCGRLVIAPHQRTTADYPRVILSGEEGRAQSFAEDGPPELLDGRLMVEIVTQGGDTCPKPLGTLRALQRRLMALLLGDERQDIAPVKGQVVFNPEDQPNEAGEGGDPNAYRWNVTQFDQISGRMLHTTSPDYVRHETTFKIELYRLRE